MKYTLAQNAISSLNIAIENFKKFYYYPEKYTYSEIDEATKICIIFLENSIELMLKAILVSSDPLSIYTNPNSKVIKKALTKITPFLKLEDILISEGVFKTITYTETVRKYSKLYHNSEKVYSILNDIGERRNAITHFGLDETDTFDGLVICILNTFDVIYNYLYPELISLDDIGDYFRSDGLIVETVHGAKPLFDENFVYNNIVDFLDELMETSEDFVCEIRASDVKSKIFEFTEIMRIVIKDNKFIEMLRTYHAEIDFTSCNFTNNDYYFKITVKDKFEVIYSQYSPFFNVTVFCGESGNIYFLVVHNEHSLYIYNDKQITWPSRGEPEPDYQWRHDCEKGNCKRFNLSKRNLLLAFENIIRRML